MSGVGVTVPGFSGVGVTVPGSSGVVGSSLPGSSGFVGSSLPGSSGFVGSSLPGSWILAIASLISLANLSTSSCVASSFLIKSSAFWIKSCNAFSCCSSILYLSFLSNKFCASSFWPISCVLSTFLTSFSLILANASFNLLLTSSTLSCGCCSFIAVFASSINLLSINWVFCVRVYSVDYNFFDSFISCIIVCFDLEFVFANFQWNFYFKFSVNAFFNFEVIPSLVYSW